MNLGSGGRGLNFAFVGIGVLALVAGLLIVYAADPTPVGFSDSVAYLVAARNFAHGRGMGLEHPSGDFSPLVHFPPMYSAVLSLPVFMGSDVLVGARWVNAILFGGWVVACWLLTLRAHRSLPLAFSVALLAAASPKIVALFVGVQSEALFLPLVLVCLLTLFGNGMGRLRAVAFAGAVASLAILTRYAGVALIFTGLAIVMLLSTQRPRERIVRAGLYVGVAISGPLLRTGYLALVYGKGLPRGAAGILASSWSHLEPFRGDLTLALWQTLPFTDVLSRPTYYGMLLGLFLLTLAVFAALIGAPRWNYSADPDFRESGTTRLWMALGIFILSYVTTLLLSYAFTVPTPDINYRMLAPVQVPIWLLLLVPVRAVAGRLREGRRALVLFPLVVAVASAPETLKMVQELRIHGAGYMTPAWRNSETVRFVMREEPGSLVSNETAALLLWADRPALEVPDVIHPVGSIELRFGDNEQNQAERMFRKGDATLILFRSIRGQLIATYGADADRRYEAMVRGLYVVAELADGVVYRYSR